MRISSIIFFVISMLVMLPAGADLRVFACEPEWAALAEEIGGDKVESFSATTAFQDAHYIRARPSLIARVRRADLVICTGANLEIGWLPVLLRKSGNPDVNPGSDGFVEASRSVRMLDVPQSADRGEGDMHPYGNPHIQTDPNNIASVAETLVERMKKLDGNNAAAYEQGHDAFARKWGQAIKRWEQRAEPLHGMKIVVHHAAWVYMENWLGLVETGKMEPKPGLPPSASHLSSLLDTINANNNVEVFIRAAYKNDRAANWLTERTGIPNIVIPHTVGAAEGADDLFKVFDIMIERLLEARG